IAPSDDQCPSEQETINFVLDNDGCPDITVFDTDQPLIASRFVPIVVFHEASAEPRFDWQVMRKKRAIEYWLQLDSSRELAVVAVEAPDVDLDVVEARILHVLKELERVGVNAEQVVVAHYPLSEVDQAMTSTLGVTANENVVTIIP